MLVIFRGVATYQGISINEFSPGLAQQLEDRHVRLRDRKLRRLVAELQDCWITTLCNAPDTPQDFAAYINPTQFEAARKGMAAVRAVGDRCNSLSRWVIGDTT